jgi:uncharacterized protein YbaR (Trm112 family)
VRPETLEILRCPYCGGRLELVESLPNMLEAGAILEGILGCHCCLFPVVGGIPVMHLRRNAVVAREAIEAGESDRAFRALVSDHEDRAELFMEVASGRTATFRELADTLGEELEGGYFLYRFSDPSFVTASAVVRAVGAPVLASGGRAIDVCGGAGHLTRVLLELSEEPPVVADLYFAKLWLAARYVAPGCEPICCDGNAPLPFARGAFDFALCADAFMYIWTKRQLVGEMERLVAGEGPGAVVITHAHNQHVWSASHGDPLPPEGYRDLFESLEPRLFAEAKLLDDVVAGGPLDLSRRDDAATLEGQEAVTIVAARGVDAYQAHPLGAPKPVSGELRLNPLYAGEDLAMGLRMRLAFPSVDYEDEYGAVRRYLPEELTLDRATVDAVSEGRRTPQVRELLKKRIVLDMPERYY